MKRILAAVAALFLLIVPTVKADRLAIVYSTRTPYSAKTTDDNTSWLSLRRVVQSVADKLGMDYDIFPDYAFPTIYGFNVTAGFPPHTRSYAATAYIGYRAGTQVSGDFSADSFTVFSPWNGAGGRPTNQQRNPIVLFGTPTINNSSGAWQSAALCSTGVSVALSPFSSLGYGGQSHSAYLVGTNFVWKEWDNLYPLPRIATPPPGILRTIIGFKTANATPFASGGDYRCQDCDEIIGGTSAAASDTLGPLWARYIDSAPTSRSQAMFFCWPAPNHSYRGGSYSAASIAQAFVALDSAAGGKLIGVRPGWKPIDIALVIGRGFSRSAPTTAPTLPTNYGGVAFNGGAGGFTDTTRLYQTAGDVGRLGAPITLTVNIDSVQANWQENRYWAQIPSIQYALESTSGAISSSKTTRASKYRIADPFGAQRARAIGYFGNPIADDDTTMQGLLRFGRARIDSIWPGKASRAVFPCNYDGIPSNFPFRSLPNINTYNMALWTAGFRVVAFAPDYPNTSPSNTWSLNGSGNAVWATENAWFGPAEQRYPVFTDSASTTKIGSVFHVAVPTGFIAEYSNKNLIMAHNAANDFVQGIFTDNGVAQDYINYYHSFRQPRHILRYEAYSLYSNNVDEPNRYGYWQMKSVVHSMKALNALSWKGREIVRFVYAGDL